MSNPPPVILLVEDDVDVAGLVRLVLDQQDHQVVWKMHGQDALSYLTALPPDQWPSLILLDIKMPVMNGVQFATALAELQGPPIPIVVMSAADDAESIAAKIGAVDWMAKPFDVDDLVALAQKHMQ
jgi:DNA-binding response OmpR family regulator